MEDVATHKPAFFLVPLIGTIAGIAILLSPAFTNTVESFLGVNDEATYTYYEKTITEEELDQILSEKNVYTVRYSAPVNGVIGSVWNTEEEAKQAEQTYRNEQGGPDVLPESDNFQDVPGATQNQSVITQ
ncbi:hypothetical protein [Stomatohabitans albus]|uniref:hypothetical protein n=1 Tax=Stomatohabitans albus TaxID=3110766 RepID=UPI00300CC529